MKSLLLLAVLGFGAYWAYNEWFAAEPPPPPKVEEGPDRLAFAESFFFRTRVKALVTEVERRTIVRHQENAIANTTTDMGRQLSALREYTIKEGKLYDDASFEKAILRGLRALGHTPDQCKHLLERIMQEAKADTSLG